jgi:hypothetical protein
MWISKDETLAGHTLEHLGARRIVTNRQLIPNGCGQLALRQLIVDEGADHHPDNHGRVEEEAVAEDVADECDMGWRMAHQLGAGTLENDRSDGPVGVRSPVAVACLSCIQPTPQASRTQVVESDTAIAFDQFDTTLRKLIDRIIQRPPFVPA